MYSILWHCVQKQHFECCRESLTLCEHFINEIWSEHPTAAHNCIFYVSEVCWMVVKCAARVTAVQSGWPKPLEVSRRRKVCLWLPITCKVTDGLHTVHRHVILLTWALKLHLTPKADGWNDCERVSIDWRYSFRSFLWSKPSRWFSLHQKR